MRRALYLLAAVLAGAVSAASAQVRSPQLIARIDTAADDRHGLLVHVSGLVDSPEWLDRLRNGYTIELHWTVTLWKRNNAFRSTPESPREWTSQVAAPPYLSRYTYTEVVPGPRQQFSTLDSLRAYLATEQQLRQPPNKLAPGDWFYIVTVDITGYTQEQLDDRASASGVGGGVIGIVRRLVNGQAPTVTLQSRIPPFTVQQ